ncbi:hypothetical protein HW452_05110 [Halomonas aquamarina]|uniref:Uncharacterized protein n=1 Tax=Vreelandella aquamarina TaxID=77097 RepID=A0ACC5VSP1_9GAMM|nr:DUF6246 family protein [Halomonas aquamarina]MBZ5486900.1 hypothetical protein [Halomonas aquamarina]
MPTPSTPQQQANVYAGELSITWQGRDWLFRPTLAAMAELGEPAEIVRLLGRIQAPGADGFVAALAVLRACHVGDDDISPLIGFFKDVRGRLRYVMGALPLQNIHVLGAKLAIAGIVGAPKPRKGGGKPMAAFDPAEFVGVAQAHLGLSSAEAWAMTMIEFQRAMDAKFPESESKKAEQPTEEEAAATVDHIMQLRQRIKEQGRLSENSP